MTAAIPEPRRASGALWALRVLTVLLASALAVGLAVRWVNQPRLALELVAGGFDRPTALLDLDGRLVVSQQDGLVRFMDETRPYLDLTSAVTTEDWEQGFYDLALSPGYPDDDRLFVSFANLDGDVVVASLHLDGDRARLTPIITVEKPTPVHNGGRMAFGPDGYLYVGFGDGGPGDIPDPDRQGQNPSTFLGSILRLDVSSDVGYRVPADNPFVAGGGAPEVWAYGVRNPYGISFDPATGDLWLVDVGHGEHEEVNYVPANSDGGLNFGWSRYEGMSCFRPEEGCDTGGLTMPIVDLSHEDGSCAVIGGEVYRGKEIQLLVGRYVFSDYCTGRIYSVGVSGSSIDLRVEVDTRVQPTAIETDATGEMYVLTYAGEVLRIVPAR